jgi:carboxyl-terminal processing protease
MLASLDDNHTTFIERDDYRRMSENTYVGIGVRLSQPEPGQAPVVVEVFRGSPAAQSNIKVGDRIESVDGTATAGAPLTEIVKQIRGAPGTRVQIGISRRAQSERLTADVNRAAVEPRRVEGGPLGSGMGYVKIRGFTADVPNQVFDFLNRHRTAGLRGLILDLRGNTGGALNAVGNVGGAFFPGKPLGISVGRDGAQEPIRAEGRKLSGDDPIVVLIDRDTGSGAEILAAAMREHQVAVIVGTNSAGSVGIAQVHQLPDGSAVQITERRLVTPSGQRLDRVGVKPDIEVPTTIPDLEAGKDPPLERAIQYIQQNLRPAAAAS